MVGDWRMHNAYTCRSNGLEGLYWHRALIKKSTRIDIEVQMCSLVEVNTDSHDGSASRGCGRGGLLLN